MVNRLEFRVRYAETDQMGIVYYSNYFVWYEMGRTELFRKLGFPYRALEEQGIYLPVIETYNRYRNPARYDDLVVLETTVSKFSPVRIQFDYKAYGPEGKLLAEGYTVHGFVDRKGRPVKTSRHFPELWESMSKIAEINP